MTACDKWRDDLKAYADGELPSSRRLLVRLHLTRCALCREEVTAMEAIGNDLRASDTVEMPSDLRDRILSVAPDGEGAPAPAPLRPTAPVWRRPMVWYGAVATLFVGSVMYSFVDDQVRGMTASSRSPQYMMKVAKGSAPIASDAKSDLSAPESMRGFAGPPPSAGGRGVVPMSPDGAMSSASEQGTSVTEAMPSAERYVSRSATITVSVQDIESRCDEVESMTRKSGGFVANNALSTGEDGLRSASLTIRVPVTDFDSILGRIAKLGMVSQKNVTGEDITEQVSDEQQAVRVLTEEIRAADARLRQNSQDWTNQAAARDLRIRKAQSAARLDLLKKQARLATIQVQLTERSKTQVRGGFADDMGDAGRSALNGFLTAVRIPVLVLMWVVAYAPIWIPLAVGYRWAARQQRKRAGEREVRNWRATQ